VSAWCRGLTIQLGRWKTGLITVGFALLAALGQSPFEYAILSLAGFSGGLWLISGQTPRVTAWRTLLFGSVYFAASLNWVVHPFLVEPEVHGWMAPFGLLFLSVGLSLFWVLPSAFLARVIDRPGPLVIALGIAAGESARALALTGFPWAQAGHIWIDTPIAQVASVVGAFGLTALTLFVAGLLVTVRRRRITGLGVVLIFIVGSWWGLDRSAHTRPILASEPLVRIIQPNALQRQKWDPRHAPRFLARQIAMTLEQSERPLSLIVWPETAIYDYLNNAELTVAQMAAAKPSSAELVFGARRFEGQRLYNSLVLMGADGRIASLYDKQHLVPLGEYVPIGNILAKVGIRGFASENGAGYSAGTGTTLMPSALGMFRPLICYEGIFAEEIVPGARPNYLLLITNDGWFGTFSGPQQHFTQARFRAIEQGLPMIRAANTGVSAMIDAYGNVIASIDVGVAGYIDAALPDALPATIYARFGNWMFLLILLGWSGVIATLRRIK
jgi:apolipoprotein N-acyltransferase